MDQKFLAFISMDNNDERRDSYEVFREQATFLFQMVANATRAYLYV